MKDKNGNLNDQSAEEEKEGEYVVDA